MEDKEIEKPTINKKKFTERKRALRRNVKLKLKAGYFENLPEKVDIEKLLEREAWD
jgi:hypothetical protein